MYSRAIWGQYVTRRFGINAMRRCWELTRGTRPAEAIDLALREYGSSFENAFAEWTTWNYFTGTRSDPASYYEEGAFFPPITVAPAEYVAPAREIPGTLDPMAARFYEISPGSDTLTVIVEHLDLPDALAGGSASPYSLFVAGSRLDNSYRPTPIFLFVKVSAVSPFAWELWSIVRGIPRVVGSTIGEGTAFPNPFRPDGVARVLIPIDASSSVHGTVTIFTSGMDRVRSFTTLSQLEAGRHVFAWDGKTDDGELAETGVYLVVINVAERIVTSKIAVVKSR
jgi:hypothetical protein